MNKALTLLLVLMEVKSDLKKSKRYFHLRIVVILSASPKYSSCNFADKVSKLISNGKRCKEISCIVGGAKIILSSCHMSVVTEQSITDVQLCECSWASVTCPTVKYCRAT